MRLLAGLSYNYIILLAIIHQERVLRAIDLRNNGRKAFLMYF